MRTLLIIAILLLLGLGVTMVGSGPVATAGAEVDFTADPADQDAFAFEVREVNRCGATCGAVVAALTNTRSAAVTGVTVDARAYAGKVRDADDRFWASSEPVGRIGPGETVSLTREVDVGASEIGAVRAADGWVTLEIVVRSDDVTVRFTAREQVG